MTKEALQEQGYEVVDFDLTDEELALGTKYLCGIVTNGQAGGTIQDCYKHCEAPTLNSWLSFTLYNMSPM